MKWSYIYEFNRVTGKARPFTSRRTSLLLYQLAKNVEIATNVGRGCVTNKGMEGRALHPDGRLLVG